MPFRNKEKEFAHAAWFPARSGARFHGSSSAVPELSGRAKGCGGTIADAVNGITLLSFDSQQIVSIGNQTSGR